jgi:hypothetical protein
MKREPNHRNKLAAVSSNFFGTSVRERELIIENMPSDPIVKVFRICKEAAGLEPYLSASTLDTFFFAVSPQFQMLSLYPRLPCHAALLPPIGEQ